VSSLNNVLDGLYLLEIESNYVNLAECFAYNRLLWERLDLLKNVVKYLKGNIDFYLL